MNLGLHPNLVTQIRATYQFFGAQILQRKFLSASGIVKHMNETPFTFHPEYRLGFMATDQKFSDLTTGNFQDILYKTCLDHFRVIVKENPLIFMRGVDPNHSVVLN